MNPENIHPEGQILLDSIKTKLPELKELLKKSDAHWASEDAFYRFYHRSFKVYALQNTTQTIVETLKSIQPNKPLNPLFLEIIQSGTEKKWEPSHNQRWTTETRPILEAFFHAQKMLQLAVKYGQELDYAPNCLPSGWAAILYLYNIR